MDLLLSRDRAVKTSILLAAALAYLSGLTLLSIGADHLRASLVWAGASLVTLALLCAFFLPRFL